MKQSFRAPLGLLVLFLICTSASAQQVRETYGTSATTYVHVPAIEFQPLRGVDGPVYTTGSSGTSGRITRYGSGNSLFTSPLHLPSGALITYLELDYCDDNAGSNRSTLTLVDTHWDGNVTSTLPNLTSVNNGCSFVTADESSQGMVVDNYLQTYSLVFYHNIGDGSESIAGAIVGYELRVSPAPAVATFGDVPTSHPFYQYIEALAASGITGGCGGGNYCPDNALTRGQMAVFLAKALGLHFQ